MTDRPCLVLGSLVAFFLCVALVFADEQPPAEDTQPVEQIEPVPVTPGPQDWLKQAREESKVGARRITPWWTWGADLRLRQEYIDNVVDLEDDTDSDQRWFWRLRGRIWSKFGPFFPDETSDKPNGLYGFVRLTTEPRYYEVGAGSEFKEGIWDNLYLDWQRIGGLPVSVRLGRWDVLYGRGFILLDGTPLDGSRTIYSDAAKVTFHFDSVKTDLDLLYINNEGEQDRLRPIDDDGGRLCEFDEELFGAYLISKVLEGQEIHAYYIYKEDDPLSGVTSPNRNVNTLGGLVQGKLARCWDYYLEGAVQWGSEGSFSRRGWGLSSDFGYTFCDCSAKPRVHFAYEYLSGDDPTTSRFEGWDPVLARWPHYSELYVYRWAFPTEGGLPGNWTNVQRFGTGIGFALCDQVDTSFDYSFLLANQHPAGETPPYDSGRGRGHLLSWILNVKINPSVSGHFWLEYFLPGSFYAGSANDAIFARWQINLAY
ncbi:MAG: alginate export family protein [Planctomycetota bacterium]